MDICIKKGKLLVVFALVLLSLSMVSAIDLTIKKNEISSLAIIELDKPAIFELEITNNENLVDTFELYSFVGRVYLEPKEPFTIPAGETRTITLEAHPINTPGYFSFEYKIKNSKGEIQTDNLAIEIANLANAFNIYADNINPESEKTIVHFENKGGHGFDEIVAKISCSFFSTEQAFSLAPNEKKEFAVEVNKDKLKELLAGPYILISEIKTGGRNAKASSIFRYTEHSDLAVSETTEGFLLRRQEITKTNQGNVQLEVETVISKDSFTALFTTFNIAPKNKDTVGFKAFYIFEKSLAPGDELKVIARTNWWLLALIIICIALIIYLSKKYFATKVVLTKRATFVKTKGGEFALKISLVLKARDFVEKVKLVDKIPHMVKIYERYGTISPDKIDEKNKRIEWNVESLGKGEERIFSYIIYSKMGVIGKFELPEAKAFFEFKGILKDVTSNKSFFINEPESGKPEIRGFVEDVI